MRRHYHIATVISALAVVLCGRAAHAQDVSAGLVAMATAHDLMSDGLYGFGATVRLPVGGRASVHFGGEHVTGTARRPGILCAGLAQPGTCMSAEPVRDDARLTTAVGGFGLRVLGTARRSLAVSGDVRVGWVHAESQGATSGAKLADGKSLIGGELGVLATWSLTRESPLALEVAGSLGEMRPIIKEQVVDGYNPFWTDFNVARARFGVRWDVGR